MASSDEWLNIRVRLIGARTAQGELVATGAAVKGFGNEVLVAGKKTEFSRIETFAWRQGLFTLRRQLYAVTLLLGGLGAGALHVGFGFLEAEEKSTSAFTGLLGNTRLARSEVEQLVALTHETGFQLPQLTDAATKMLDFGFSVQQTNEQLRAFAIFSQKRNLGAEGVTALTGIFARIKDQGQLTGRVLLQLMRLGVPALKILREQLKLTDQQVQDLRKGKLVIPAQFALPALTRGIALTPGTLGLGGLAGIARSWVAELTGTIEKPLFAWANRMTPRINALLARAVAGFKAGGFEGMFTAIDPSGRLTTAWITLGNVLTTVWRVVTVGAGVLRTLLPILSFGAGLVVLVAGHSKVLAAILYLLAARYLYLRGVMLAETLALKLNLYWTKGAAAAEKLYTFWVLRAEYATLGMTRAQKFLAVAFRITGISAAAAWVAALGPVGWIILGVAALTAVLVGLYLKWQAFHDAVNNTFGWIKDHWPLLLAILGGPVGLAVYAIIRHFDDVKQAVKGALNWIISAWNRLHFTLGGWTIPLPGLPDIHIPSITVGLPHIPYLAAGGTILHSGAAVVGERGPELLHLPAGATVQPLAQGGGGLDLSKVIQVVLTPSAAILRMNGRDLAETAIEWQAAVEARA